MLVERHDWTHDQYHQHPATSRSRVADLLRDPALYAARHEHHELDQADTKALRFGQLFHLLILEPARWRELVAVEPEGLDKRTKVAKAWAKEAEERGRLIVSMKDAATLAAMRDALFAEPASNDRTRQIAQAAISRGRREVSYTWRDHVTGIACKARLDTVLEDRSIIVDLKTTSKTDPDRIAWSCRDYLYHLQDAWYSEPLRLEGASPRFLLVFVPKTPPHTPVAVRFDDDLRADGRELMRRGLDELALRRRSGDWLADHHKAPITVGRRGWRP